MITHTIAEEIAELERELEMRETYYPMWYNSSEPKKKITKQEAMRRISTLKSTISRLKSIISETTCTQTALEL